MQEYSKYLVDLQVKAAVVAAIGRTKYAARKWLLLSQRWTEEEVTRGHNMHF